MRDILGGTLSCLCIFHCTILPFVVGLLPAFGVLAENEIVHFVLLGLVLFISAPVLLVGLPLFNRLLAGAGLLLMFSAVFAKVEWVEQAVTVAGCAGVLLAHFLRYKLNLRGAET